MRRLAPAMVLVVGACSPTVSTPTNGPPVIYTVPTTTTIAPLPLCDPPPFVPATLPQRVVGEGPAPGDVPLDRYTLVPGTSVLIWAGTGGEPALALVRGALPQYPGQRAKIEVRGFDAVIGPLEDEVIGIGWFESEDRCDQYALIFYPPVTPEAALEVAGSIPAP